MSFASKKRSFKNNFSNHDDREQRNYDRRFFMQKNNFKNKKRGNNKLDEDRVRKLLREGDVNMSVNVTNGDRNAKFCSSKFSGRRVNFNSGQRNTQNASCWYKIILFHGKKYPRNELLLTVLNYINRPLIPFSVRYDGEHMIFYVDDEITANAISSANGKIEMPDGFKLRIKSHPGSPVITINPELKNSIQNAMSKKFDASVSSLDLSQFHRSQDFIDADKFVPLSRPNVMKIVLDIIGESVPNLTILNLSNNKICLTDHFGVLKRVAPRLVSLNLSNNKIASLNNLDCLSGMKLETLVLDENPLCDKFRSKTDYVSNVRKIFKNLTSLDGVNLPPPMKFDIEEPVSQQLPRSHDSFLCNTEGKDFLKQFLEEYFNMYDNQNNRNSLVDAYSPNAVMSMTAFHVHHPRHQLEKYMPESRNLKKVSINRSIEKMLHTGNHDIVAFVNKLPKTKHHLSSFVVDLVIYTPQLITLNVCGVFFETNMTKNMRSFNRVFVLDNTTTNGLKIVNDMLTVTMPPEAVAKKIQQEIQSNDSMAVAGSSSSSSDVSTIAQLHMQSPQLVGPSNIGDAEIERKREMVKALSEQTSMNLVWSEKCLNEMNWNFNNALMVFTQFNANGQIPNEAFDK